MEDENIHHHQCIIASFINFRSPSQCSPVVKAVVGELMAAAGPRSRRRLRPRMLKKLRRRIAQLRKQRRALEHELMWEWRQVLVTSSCAPSNTGFWTMPSNDGCSCRWFETACVCCKRPLDICVFKWRLHGSWRYDDERLAYMAAIWGADQGYVLGALVLGQRLRELGTRADLVLLHTDDVPPNYLALLNRFWLLRLVDYIDGARSLYLSKGTNFDGVFTKINAWAATQYNKVLLLDIDMIPLRSLDELFSLSTPAAMARGNHNLDHGDRISGKNFSVPKMTPSGPGHKAAGSTLALSFWSLMRPCST